MYSDMSRRTIAVSSLNRYSASALVSSVLPTPVGPKNMNDPIGRLGSCKPARDRRTAVATACTASAWPTTRLPSMSSMRSRFAFSPPGLARPPRGDVVGRDGFLHHFAGVFPGLDLGKPLLEFRNPAIGQFARALILAATLRVGEFDAQAVEFALELLRVRQLVLLRAPARGQVRRALFQIDEFLVQRLQAAF